LSRVWCPTYRLKIDCPALEFGYFLSSGVTAMTIKKKAFGKKNVYGKGTVHAKKTVYGSRTTPPKKQ
jgi:hypothetical protein